MTEQVQSITLAEAVGYKKADFSKRGSRLRPLQNQYWRMNNGALIGVPDFTKDMKALQRATERLQLDGRIIAADLFLRADGRWRVSIYGSGRPGKKVLGFAVSRKLTKAWCEALLRAMDLGKP